MIDTSSSKKPLAYRGDAGYRGTGGQHVEQVMKLKFGISQKIKDGFAVLPKR